MADLKDLEREIEQRIEKIEKAVFQGDYNLAYDEIQKLKPFLTLAEELNLWKKGNKWFAVVEQTKKVKEAFSHKNLKELKENLLGLENLLR